MLDAKKLRKADRMLQRSFALSYVAIKVDEIEENVTEILFQGNTVLTVSQLYELSFMFELIQPSQISVSILTDMDVNFLLVTIKTDVFQKKGSILDGY
jgi:hypothetical protein